MILEYVRLDQGVIHLKPTKIKVAILNFAIVFLTIAINLYIKSINVVNVELANGSQTISYVEKYADYYDVINYITFAILLLCVIITVVSIIIDNRKIIKRFNYLVSLFENVGLSKIRPDKSKLTEYDMQVVDAWNSSIEEISQLNELREKYFKNMVHDLKTPVQLLKMNVEMLEFDQGDNEYLTALSDELKNLEKNINNYLLVEKITFFEKVQKEQFLISDYFSYQIKRYKKLEFDVIINTNVSAINADRKMFGRIVENIIDNAMKYGSEKKIYIDIDAEKMTFTNKVDTTNLGNIFVQKRNYSVSGNGLGIEIINTYIRLLGWKVSSEQIDNQFIVTIDLNIK